MNYKEKYEMALEGIQEILGSGEDSIKMSRLQLRLQGIFPELKESEDEKIRKDIVFYIAANHKDDGEKARWLYWLEKQGEMDMKSYKAAEDEKREYVGDGFIKCYADFQDFKEGETYWLEYVGNDNYNVRSDNLLGKTYHITPCQLYTVFKKQTWLEKQYKQSPKNTNKECLKGIKRVQEYQDLSDWEKVFDNIASMYANNKNQEGYNESWYVKERAAAMLYYAKKELEKQGKQKPNKCMYSNDAYTDEDRKVLCEGCGEDCKFKQKAAESPTFKDKLLELFQKFRYIKDDVPTNGDIIDYVDTHIQELIDTIQKPVEWSEEDENNILFLTSIIEECFKDKEKITLCADTVCANFTKENVIDRLKSLKERYTWKPSDEQMTALRRMKNAIGGEGEIYEPLNSLYEDLNKLKEK